MENAASASGATPLLGYPDAMRVLAVDDDPVCLTTLTQMLQRCGYQVTAKASPEEALREVRQHPEVPFDLVMTVAHTRGKGIDGFALLKHLKNRLPVIMFSGEEPVGTVKRAVLGGACDFLTKPLRDDQVQNIWKHVVRWRLNAANGTDPRKRGSAGAANDSGEGGSQQRQKQCRATKKAKIDPSPEQQLHASIVEAAELLRGTEGYCPRGIRELLVAQGVEVTIEQATSHLEIYERECLTNDRSAMPSNYSTPGSSGSYMRSQGATNINQTSLLSNGASPVGRGLPGNENYGASYVAHLHGNVNGNVNIDTYYGNGPPDGSMVTESPSSNLAQVQQAMPSTGVFPSNMMGTMNDPNPIRQQAMPTTGVFPNNMMGTMNDPNPIRQQAMPTTGVFPSNMMGTMNDPNPIRQQAMPNTGVFPSNMMVTMNDSNPIRQQAFPQISQLSYNGSTGGISMSPWHVAGGDDSLRSCLGENEVMQNTAGIGMTQGMHGDGAAGQTSASLPQDLTNFFSWENINGNGPTGTSGGSGIVNDMMEIDVTEDDIDKFLN